MNRESIYYIIDKEREYQDFLWKNEPMHTPTEWLVYMQRYLTIAMEAATMFPTPACNDEVMANIRKITAMGVAAMEQNYTPIRMF